MHTDESTLEKIHQGIGRIKILKNKENGSEIINYKDLERK